MQAHINFNKSIYSTLYYHERKHRLGVAECIAAGNFIKDAGDLDFQDKQYHLQRLAGLNEAVTNRVLHIALTFHPSERLSDKQMVGMAEEYLREMRLAHQPYLVYRHRDTLSPHMHVVMAGVQKDAMRVHLTPADYHRSHNIVQTLNVKHQLVPSLTAEERRQRQGQTQKVIPGKMSLRPGIGNVLNKVVSSCKYTSLEEFNAVLRLYNIQAFRGREGTDMYCLRGLAYRALDDNGKPVFGQIKASGFDDNPTLPRLEQWMALNLADPQRQQHRQRVTTLLEWHSTKKNIDLPALEKALQRERISMVWMKEQKGASEKLFFVDHATRAVFAGDAIGYDALTLRQRLTPVQIQEQKQELQQRHRHRIRYEL